MTRPTTLSWIRSPHADPSLPTLEQIDRSQDAKVLQVTHAKSIAATLREMVVASEPVTVYLADGVSCVSGRFAQLLEPRPRFVLVTEQAPVPPAGPAIVVAAPDNFRIQFHAQFEWRQLADQTLEAQAELPGSLVRLQRRQHLRVETPLGPSLRAEFHAQGKKRMMTVDDLSLGGVGLRGPLREHRDLLTNQRLERVRLELGTTVLMDVRLDVCSRRSYRSFLAGEQLHFGCQFVDLPDSARQTLEDVLLRLEQERGQGGAA